MFLRARRLLILSDEAAGTPPEVIQRGGASFPQLRRPGDRRFSQAAIALLRDAPKISPLVNIAAGARARRRGAAPSAGVSRRLAYAAFGRCRATAKAAEVLALFLSLVIYVSPAARDLFRHDLTYCAQRHWPARHAARPRARFSAFDDASFLAAGRARYCSLFHISPARARRFRSPPWPSPILRAASSAGRRPPDMRQVAGFRLPPFRRAAVSSH